MSVFTGTGEGEDYDNTLPPGTMLSPELVDEIPVQRIQFPQGASRPKVRMLGAGLIRYLKESEPPPDVLQFLTLPPLRHLIGLRRLGIPTVYSQTMLSNLSDHPARRFVQRINRRLPLETLDCVVVSSSVMRDQLRGIGLRTRVEVIPNGVDLKTFSPLASLETRQSLRNQLGLNPTAPIVVCVGSISPRKGIDVLLRAWKQVGHDHPDAYLVLVGAGLRESQQGVARPEFHDLLQSIIDSSEAGKRVIFTGLVKNVQDYLRAADLFVFPSHQEGMPNVVLEAFACGLPSILVPFIGLPTEFGRPDEEYMLVERSPEALANAMDTLLDTPERREALGQQARRWVEDHLGIEKSLDRYVELYRDLRR